MRKDSERVLETLLKMEQKKIQTIFLQAQVISKIFLTLQ